MQWSKTILAATYQRIPWQSSFSVELIAVEVPRNSSYVAWSFSVACIVSRSDDRWHTGQLRPRITLSVLGGELVIDAQLGHLHATAVGLRFFKGRAVFRRNRRILFRGFFLFRGLGCFGGSPAASTQGEGKAECE